MPTFAYKATDSSGKVVNGLLEADAEKGVVSELHSMGLIPIRITASGGRSSLLDLDVIGRITALFNSFSGKDLLLFTQDLATLLEAGLPVDRALATIIDAADKERVKEVTGDILKAVQGGGYLSDALARHPDIFSTFYVNMVKAGEAGGVLESVLARLAEFLESSQELRDYIKSAMVYPAFLVAVGGLSIIILLTFVIPKFSVIFSDMGQTIPVTTRFLLGLSDILRSYWWAILAVLAGLGLLFRRYVNTPEGRLRMDQKKLDFPVVGDLVRKIEVSRFARTLGTLANSGVPILQAIRLVREIMTNQVIARSMDTVYDRIKEGDRLSKSLRVAGLFPSLAVQMITVGEETGRLDAMLLKVADNYEKMVKALVKRLIGLLEPAMILAMGLIVGFVVISMLMAIFSMNEMPF